MVDVSARNVVQSKFPSFRIPRLKGGREMHATPKKGKLLSAPTQQLDLGIPKTSIQLSSLSPSMDEEEDDDIYAPADEMTDPAQPYDAQKANRPGPEKAGVDLEEGEEEGEEVEESDSVRQSYAVIVVGC